MRWLPPLLISLVMVCPAQTLPPVELVPESQQAPLALKLLDAYHGTRPAAVPRKLHVVYFTPADRDPEPRYRERLEGVVEDIRAFYREGMERSGFGPKTFDLPRDADGKLIIHLVKGTDPETAYTRSGFAQNENGDVATREKIMDSARPVLKVWVWVCGQPIVWSGKSNHTMG
jgi:hypothetical protein